MAGDSRLFSNEYVGRTGYIDVAQFAEYWREELNRGITVWSENGNSDHLVEVLTELAGNDALPLKVSGPAVEFAYKVLDDAWYNTHLPRNVRLMRELLPLAQRMRELRGMSILYHQEPSIWRRKEEQAESHLRSQDSATASDLQRLEKDILEPADESALHAGLQSVTRILDAVLPRSEYFERAFDVLSTLVQRAYLHGQSHPEASGLGVYAQQLFRKYTLDDRQTYHRTETARV